MASIEMAPLQLFLVISMVAEIEILSKHDMRIAMYVSAFIESVVKWYFKKGHIVDQSINET